MMGGLAYGLQGDAKPLSNGQQILVALAGPAVSILMGVILGLLIFFAGSLPHYFLDEEQAILYPLFFSLGWGILNLVPIYPLDGGKILRYLLEYNPRWHAEKIAIIVGLVLGGLVICYTLFTGQIWNSVVVGLLLSGNIARLQAIRFSAIPAQIEEINQLIGQEKWEESMQQIGPLIPRMKEEQTKAYLLSPGRFCLTKTRRHAENGSFC